MRYLDEFRDPAAARALVAGIAARAEKVGKPTRVMEICGSHTVAIFRSGLKAMLPPGVTMVSGPGCPVCITAMDDVDRMVALAEKGRPGGEAEGLIIATFGDMLKVPGSRTSLERERARGADVRVATSPLDALAWAQQEPGRQVAFLGIGFETTSPLVAATVKRARELGVGNLTVYPAFKLLPPAMEALLGSGETAIDAFLCPGHVSVMLGLAAYRPLAARYGRPCVVAGFEPLDILLGLDRILAQRERGVAEAENEYGRAVTEEGNTRAMGLLAEVFRPADARWRGLGPIPGSGLAFAPPYAAFDARARFRLDQVVPGPEPKGCACGAVLKGLMEPPRCPLFGRECTPEDPVGSCMVSSEGSCAAFFKYGGEAP